MSKPTEKPKIEDVFDDICARISAGELLIDICSGYGFTTSWFHLWLNREQSRLDSYARARETQQEAWADQIVKLADECREGETETTKEWGVETKKGDMVERSRLQIESRKWLMARLAPRKYGDKLDLKTEGKVTHEVGDSVTALMAKIRAGADKGGNG